MIRSKKRITWCVVLIACNIAFIWINSLLPREVSAAFSRVVGKLIDWLIPSQETLAEGAGNGVLRKIAHFAEFCTLGLLLSWFAQMTYSKMWRCIAVPFVFGVAVACIDEWIQSLIPGRGPGLLDVCIDAGGVCLGVLSLTWIVYIRRHL